MIVGTALELCSLLLLILGGGSFKEGLDSLAWAGYILHAPGWFVVNALNTYNLTYFVILNFVIFFGIPLFIWIGIAHFFFWMLRKKRRDQI